MNISDYYIVDKKVLPGVFAKVVQAKNIMLTNPKMTVLQAVNAAGISRSAYYKYKDYVFTLKENSFGKTVTVAFDLMDKAGLLSGVLNAIAQSGANVLTINQTIPINDVANVTITMDISGMDTDLQLLVKNLSQTEGVLAFKILARE